MPFQKGYGQLILINSLKKQVTGALHLAVFLRLQHLLPFSCPL